MKSLSGLPCVLILAVCLVGCQGGGEQQATTEETASTETQGSHETAPAAQVTEGETVTLTGTVGCGHCTFGTTDHCMAAIKVASGDIYVIDGVEEDSELWKERVEGTKQAEVTGTIEKSETDGLMHVSMSSYKIL